MSKIKAELTYGSELRIIVCVIGGVVAALLYHERVKEDAGIGSEADGAGEVGGLADGNADGFVGDRHGAVACGSPHPSDLDCGSSRVGDGDGRAVFGCVAEFDGVVEQLATGTATNETNRAVGQARGEVTKDADGDTYDYFRSHKAE